MTEAEAVAGSETLATVDSLAADLASLGLVRGSIVLVHSSLRSIGWVCGGAAAVVLALERVVGAEGTLVMPTHSGDLSDPAGWRNPPVPREWWETIRASMPPFERDLTPTRGMGAIVECFRRQRDVHRSDHPQVSFAARGPDAARIVDGHSLADGLSETSPLARIYELDGRVLLLGVGHDSNTSLHLAEYRSGCTRPERNAAPILVEGQRRWVEFDDHTLDSSDFAVIGESFERELGAGRRGGVARADALLVPQRPLVDYAVDWMRSHRSPPAPVGGE
jgi:aminoglycoside 3-N-acetyltransferase